MNTMQAFPNRPVRYKEDIDDYRCEAYYEKVIHSKPDFRGQVTVRTKQFRCSRPKGHQGEHCVYKKDNESKFEWMESGLQIHQHIV